MLSKCLGPTHPLIVVHPAILAVGSAEHAPLRINLCAKSVSSSFGVYLEDFGLWMEAPEVLPLELYVFTNGRGNVSRSGASIRTIKPSVWPPA
jgi:hypothetical protein